VALFASDFRLATPTMPPDSVIVALIDWQLRFRVL